MYLNVWSLVCGLFREGLLGVSLWEEVCHQEWVLRFQNPKPGPVSLSLCFLIMDQDIKLLGTAPVSCLFAPHHDDNGLIL